MAAEPDEAPKRFYKTSQAAAVEGGFAVMLDSRALRTPRQTRLVLPTEPLAALIATEWEAQGERIRLGELAATRLAFTAADRIGMARAQTIAEVVRYAGADLLCYFAEAPGALVARQEKLWSPWLAWADTALGVRLVRVAGIVHQAQPEASLARVGELAEATDDFGLAGLVYAAGLYGSVVLALAVLKGEVSGEEAFDVSRLDEAFQEEQWGLDDEAADRTAKRRAEAVMIGAWFDAIR